MKFRSINQKLLQSVFFLALILAISVSIVSFIIELERSNSQTKVMLNQLLDTVEGTAAIAAYSRNKEIADDVLKGLMKNDILYKAQIKSKSGFDLELLKKNAKSDEDEIKRILVSPFGDGEVLGYIIVQPTAKFKLVEAKYGAISNALTSIIIIAVASITLFMIVRSNISEPLRYVSNTLHAIQLGQKQRIPVIKKNSNDELGMLVTDINNLLKVLEENYNEERSLREKVEAIEQQLRNIFNSTSAGLFLLDTKGQLITFNKTFETILKDTCSDFSLPNTLLSSCFQEHIEFNDLITLVLESGELESEDFSLQLVKDTKLVWVHCLLSKVYDKSNNTMIEGVIFDVTKRVEIVNALAYEANHDKLTGLLRRQAAHLSFLNYMRTTEGQKVSFLFLDLDGFKQANDEYGHLAGDQVLVITSLRLNECVRKTDLVCRLGGDEFLIILLNCSDTNTFSISRSIVSSIQKVYSIDDQTNITIGASMGVAFLSDNLNDFDALVEAADEAMYEVKRKGKNGFCVSGDKKVYKV